MEQRFTISVARAFPHARPRVRGLGTLTAFMANRFITRPAVSGDLSELMRMLPELADFEIPEHRDPKDLWQGDGKLLIDVLDRNAPDSFVEVAVDAAETIQGVILVTLREELMSHAPSAHLEAIVVAPPARGQGLGKKLLAHAETMAKAAGATSLSLHVFANNVRARALYDHEGYDSELIRAIKWFD